jgi:Cation/multidrug efflux pump
VFLPGITGRLYQQFAITIAVAVIISAFNALSLSPALSALLLRPRKKARGPLGWFFGGFNRVFSSVTNGYVNWSRHAIRKSALSLGLLALFLWVRDGSAGSYRAASFPKKTRATFIWRYNYRTPRRSTARMRRRVKSKTFSVRYRASNTLRLSSGSAFSASFRILIAPSSSSPGALGGAKEAGGTIRGNQAADKQGAGRFYRRDCFCFPPPAIPGVGTSGGVTFLLQDRAGKDIGFLADNLQKFMAAAQKRPELAGSSRRFCLTCRSSLWTSIATRCSSKVST